jgi:hypothetical protein
MYGRVDENEPTVSVPEVKKLASMDLVAVKIPFVNV